MCTSSEGGQRCPQKMQQGGVHLQGSSSWRVASSERSGSVMLADAVYNGHDTMCCQLEQQITLVRAPVSFLSCLSRRGLSCCQLLLTKHVFFLKYREMICNYGDDGDEVLIKTCRHGNCRDRSTTTTTTTTTTTLVACIKLTHYTYLRAQGFSTIRDDLGKPAFSSQPCSVVSQTSGLKCLARKKKHQLPAPSVMSPPEHIGIVLVQPESKLDQQQY